MYISMKYEEKTKILVKMRFSDESDGFGFFFSKISNFRTFQIESLWNFQLVVIKVTKQSCCHGNHISRKNVISHMGKEKIPMSFITL